MIDEQRLNGKKCFATEASLVDNLKTTEKTYRHNCAPSTPLVTVESKICVNGLVDLQAVVQSPSRTEKKNKNYD